MGCPTFSGCNGTITNVSINEQWGIYPPNISVTCEFQQSSSTIDDITGTQQTLTLTDDNGNTETYNCIVLNQDATITNKVDSDYTFKVTYSMSDVRYLWQNKMISYKDPDPDNQSSTNQTGLENGVNINDFITFLKTEANVSDIILTVDDPDTYLAIDFNGSVAEGLNYLGNLVGLLPYYDRNTNTIKYLDGSDATTPSITDEIIQITYNYPSTYDHGAQVTGEFNHIPAPVNSVQGSLLPDNFTFDTNQWEFLSASGGGGLGLIPHEVTSTITIKEGDNTTIIKTAGLSFYAEAFITVRWTPRGVILKNFSLTVEQTDKKKKSTSDTFGWSFFTGDENENTDVMDVKIINQQDVLNNNLATALNMKEADPDKYPEGFTEWFAIYQPQDDKSSQIVNIICHKFWDLGVILTTEEESTNSGTAYTDISFENDILPLMWQAVTDAKTFVSKAMFTIDYGDSIQTIFPYSVTVGNPPYDVISNNDVNDLDKATQYGNTYLNTDSPHTFGYTVNGLATPSAYTLSRDIYWDLQFKEPYTKVVNKIG